MTGTHNDPRIVLTLDAGGTNFVFSAIRAGEELVQPIVMPSHAGNLDKCLDEMQKGFKEVILQLDGKPDAISFAFPGPADYPNGIIGDLPNLPAFKGGIPLGPYLNKLFHIPVFINNDGDLFAYGEAISGILPQINTELKQNGNQKRFRNLVGLTLGTGFGAGLVHNGQLIFGDNSISGEVWLMSNRVNPEYNAEEVVSTRSILAEYARLSGKSINGLMPFDIFRIGTGQLEGDKEAAVQAFGFFGRGIGDVIANLITLFDGIVVLGGGITGAMDLYMPALLNELKKPFTVRNGQLPRPVQKVYDYSNGLEKNGFLKPQSKQITIPGTTEQVSYDPVPRTVIAHSKLGASKAIQLGAYAFALNKLDKN
jgi:glucokinase